MHVFCFRNIAIFLTPHPQHATKSAKTGENVEQSFSALAQAGLLRYDALDMGFDISDIPGGGAMLGSQPKSSCGFC